MNFEYPLAITKCDGESGYVVQFIDLEEAFTQGETVDECLFNAAEVLTSVLEYRLLSEGEIPTPSKSASPYKASPSASVQAALLVRCTRKDKSLAHLARALNASWPVAQRLENPKHYPTLKQLERAAAALGKRLVLSFE